LEGNAYLCLKKSIIDELKENYDEKYTVRMLSWRFGVVKLLGWTTAGKSRASHSFGSA